MVVVHIDTIRGNHLIKPPTALAAQDIEQFSENLARLVAENPSTYSIELAPLGGPSVTTISAPEGRFVVALNALSERISVDRERAIRLAQAVYAGRAEVGAVTLIESDPPQEIGARALPLWRIDFADSWGTSLYLSATTGELVTRRHTLWRIFDFFWMLHIMDYDERSDINNPLLRVVSVLTLLLVVSGFWYLYFRMRFVGGRVR